jgi:hypothetical protein
MQGCCCVNWLQVGTAGIFLEWLRKATKSLSQDSRSSDWGLNPRSPQIRDSVTARAAWFRIRIRHAIGCDTYHTNIHLDICIIIMTEKWLVRTLKMLLVQFMSNKTGVHSARGNCCFSEFTQFKRLQPIWSYFNCLHMLIWERMVCWLLIYFD